MSGTLQVGGITLGTHNSGTGKVDITNAGTVATTTISSGTFNGTIGASATVPSSQSGCVKLYHNAFSGVTSASIDGYYDDTKYAYYELHLKNVRKATHSGTEEFFMRVNIGGSMSVQNYWYNCGLGVSNTSNNPATYDRADNDLSNICHMDNTWHIPHSGNTAGSASYHLRIGEPQNTDRYKNIQWTHSSNRHGSSGDHRAILGIHMANVETTNALTGFTFLCGSGGAFECTASLFGFRL